MIVTPPEEPGKSAGYSKTRKLRGRILELAIRCRAVITRLAFTSYKARFNIQISIRKFLKIKKIQKRTQKALRHYYVISTLNKNNPKGKQAAWGQRFALPTYQVSLRRDRKRRVSCRMKTPASPWSSVQSKYKFNRDCKLHPLPYPHGFPHTPSF